MSKHPKMQLEETVCDGVRRIGHLLRHGSSWEVYDSSGTYRCKVDSISEGRAVLRRFDQEQQELDRLADDGGRCT